MPCRSTELALAGCMKGRRDVGILMLISGLMAGRFQHHFLNRSTLPNERNLSATQLECAAVVWAVKSNSQLFYGIFFVVVSDHQPLKHLASLASKVNRVQRTLV